MAGIVENVGVGQQDQFLARTLGDSLGFRPELAAPACWPRMRR